MLARLDARTLRAERTQAKLEETVAAKDAALKQTTTDLDQVTRLAETFYQCSRWLGMTVDHLLKERGVSQNDQDPESVEAMLCHVLKDMGECAEGDGDTIKADEKETAFPCEPRVEPQSN